MASHSEISAVEGYVARAQSGVEQDILWAVVGYRNSVFACSRLRAVDSTGGVYYPFLDGQEALDWDLQVTRQIAVRVFSNSAVYAEPCP